MTRNPDRAPRFCVRRAATVAAGVLALAFGGAALAQPYGGPWGGGMHPMGGPGGPGPHGMAGPGGAEMIGRIIQNAQSQLNLNTQQQGMFDAAVAQTKSAFQTGRTLHQQVRDALAAELAKPEPDYAAVAAVADGIHAQVQDLRKGVRSAWLALYATFSVEQKAVVKDMVQKRLARADAFRQRMQQRMQGG
jgi:Spy/CpxP family protein refolding chaperone